MPLPAELAKLLETLADAAEYRVGVKRDDQLDRYRSKYDLPLPRQSQTLLAAYIRVIARHARSGGEMLRGTYAEMLRYLEYLGGAAPRFSRRKEQGQPANIVPYDQELIRKGITDLAAFAARAVRTDEGRIPFPGGWWRLHVETVTEGSGIARIWLAVWDASAREYLSDTPPAAWIPLPTNGEEKEDLREGAYEAIETHDTEHRSELAGPDADTVSPYRLRELPAPAIDFVGRSKQIAELYDHLIARGTVPVAAISGMPGVGKSELAITVAHLPALVDRFRRYVVFYQFPRATEVDRLPTPRDVMAHCLRSLDVSVNATESIEARFQQTLARVSVLVILDNLPDGWPLTDLRPPIPTSLLITSRSRVEYPGITNIRLRPLSMIRARELLVSSVPRAVIPISASLRERLKSANADAAAEIAVKETDLAGLIAILCGGLPLAIRAASGVLANLPDMEPEVYVTSLMREQERLKSLNSPGGGPYSVEAAFRVSYDLLNTEEQATFRRVGYFAGTITKERAAKGLGAVASSRLPELVRRNLVELQPYDSYRMHDLMRLFARKMLSDAERRSIDDCLLQYWRAGAAAHYDQVLNSLGQTEWRANGVRVKLEPTENDLASAIAAVSGELERYVPMFTLEGAARFGKTWSEKGVEASRRLGNRVAEALHHLQWGQHAERLKMIRDRTTAPGLRASRITHLAARSALAHYHDGMNALRGCRDRNGVLALWNLLRHMRRMHIILCDQEMVIKVSRIILNLPVRLPQWQVFASFQAIADAFFNRGELSQSEIYAQRALNVADVLELDHLRVHPLNLIGDIELLRGHRSNALIAYTEAENAGTVSSGSEQLSEYWSAGWNLSHELQDRSKVYTFHESYLMRTLLSTPVRKWREVLNEHLRWYGYGETSPHNSRFDLRVAHAYLVLGDTNTAVRWLDKAVDAGPDFWSFAAATYLPKTWLRGGRPWTPNLRAIALRLRDSIAAFGTHDSSPLLDRLASVEAET